MNPNLQEAMSDPEFAKILAESESYYEDAVSFFRWEPPNGETICMLTGVQADKVTDEKLKKDILRVRATVEIQQGELEGKSFDLSGPWGWTLRSFVGLKTLASVVAGEPITKLPECLDVLYENVGAILRVSTTRTPRERGDGMWVNHRVLERMEVGEEPEEMATDVTDGGEPAELEPTQ